MVDYDVEEEQKEKWSILRVGGSVAEILTESLIGIIIFFLM